MPRESDRVTIGKQLTLSIVLNILDSESSSSSDNDLEMFDLLNTDDESASSSWDSDSDSDLFEKNDDKIGDLTTLMDVVEQRRYLTRSERSPYPHAPMFMQLAIALDCFGHEGNDACLNRTMLMWGVYHGSMVNRVMTASESAMGHEIAWLDHPDRAANAAHFATLGFPSCIGLVDCTLVKLSQRPTDDGETYFDRKSNYSMNV
ncbi:hypothetical protein R1sor_014185 [Riccia sorocarpa]|uniref:DDE Tnp4 domain-containing protein n=1 Tax=Riccia sorocarpa TaxID=122646 RepID=A0ABD3HAI9_9MARC